MNAKEAELVTEEFCDRDETYNICAGGKGGFSYINRTGLTNINSDIKYAATKNWQRQEYRDAMRQIIKERHKAGKMKSSYFGNNPDIDDINRKNAWSEAAIKKRKDSWKKIKHQQGENNSQFGTTWIWHELHGNKKIKKEELDTYLSIGWIKAYKPGYKIK